MKDYAVIAHGLRTLEALRGQERGLAHEHKSALYLAGECLLNMDRAEEGAYYFRQLANDYYNANDTFFRSLLHYRTGDLVNWLA